MASSVKADGRRAHAARRSIVSRTPPRTTRRRSRPDWTWTLASLPVPLPGPASTSGAAPRHRASRRSTHVRTRAMRMPPKQPSAGLADSARMGVRDYGARRVGSSMARRRPRPGPQRGAASWSGLSRDARSRNSTAGSRSWSSTAARPTAAAPSSSAAARGRPHPAARQPRAGHAQCAQHRPARRARHLRGPHGRPHALSPRLHRARASSGSSAATSPACRARNSPSATGRPVARSRSRSRARSAWVARGSAGAPHARRTWTRVLRRVAARPAASSSAGGTRAGRSTRTPSWRRASERDGGRIVCLPEMAARYAPRPRLRSARAPVLALRAVPGQDRGPSSRRPCAARMSSRPGWWPSSRAPPCPSPRATPLRVAVALYGGRRCWPRAGVSAAGTLGRARASRQRRAGDHAPVVGRRVPRGLPALRRAVARAGSARRSPRTTAAASRRAGPPSCGSATSSRAFPALSETFVLRELAEMDARPGVRCELFSLFPEASRAGAPAGPRHGLARRRRASPAGAAVRAAYWAAQRPVRLAGLVAAVVRDYGSQARAPRARARDRRLRPAARAGAASRAGGPPPRAFRDLSGARRLDVLATRGGPVLVHRPRPRHLRPSPGAAPPHRGRGVLCGHLRAQRAHPARDGAAGRPKSMSSTAGVHPGSYRVPAARAAERPSRCGSRASPR